MHVRVIVSCSVPGMIDVMRCTLLYYIIHVTLRPVGYLESGNNGTSKFLKPKYTMAT